MIPYEILIDTTLAPLDKILYGEIRTLSKKSGYCFATNNYFAKKYNVSIDTIKRSLKRLKDNTHIVVINDKGKRKIYSFSN